MQPSVYSAKDHPIDNSLIDADALSVIQRLSSEGFTAYLVGGGVRDLLLGRPPKDYDISTSAKPEEIKQIFRRQCLLIGRRFRLAHIRFGKKIFEVSTFRAGDPEEGELIVSDNVWGTPEEDVLRRDFTMNGLFYDPTESHVIDFVGGMDDIHKGVLRSIGEAPLRFRQDPVRMLRLLKFRARFDFSIEPETHSALAHCRYEITKSAEARVLEELLRMLESGSATQFIHLLQENGFLEILLPKLAQFLETPQGNRVYHMLECADKVHDRQPERPLDRSSLMACLIFPMLEQQIRAFNDQHDKVPNLGEIMTLATQLYEGVIREGFPRFPRRISSLMTYILTTQYRLTPLTGRRHLRHRMIQTREFGAALEFLKLRALSDETLVDTYKMWKEAYSQVSHHTHIRSSHTHSRSRRPRRRRRSPS